MFFIIFSVCTIINVPSHQPTIQDGINAATNSDTVHVQPGLYVENINFSGKLITVGSLFLTTQDTTYISSTIIDGNSSGRVVTFSNGENTTAVLCGFTITNGSADYGGGICCYGSSPSLWNVSIFDNTASYDGGGICCYFSNPILINSILWEDIPQAIFIYSDSVTATYSDIEGGWPGTGNINADPLFVYPFYFDCHLQSTSPCIDAGDPASPLDPDSTIADMRAYYFHQTIALDPPQNVTIEIDGTDVHLNWDAVTGANSYKVYSSNDPYTGFVEDTSGVFAGESWSSLVMNEKKFYYVTAVN